MRLAARLAALSGIAALLACAGVAQGAPDRYSLVNGCYALRSVATGALVARSGNDYSASSSSLAGALPLRMQASALGEYMLVGPDLARVASNGQGAVSPSPTPDDSTVWRVDATPTGSFTFTSTATHRVLAVASGGSALRSEDGGAGQRAQFTVTRTSGCDTPPEAQVDATGTTFHGQTSTSEVRGTIDPHTHFTAFEFIGGDFHCGRPWDAFGVTVALPDCASIQGPQGSAAPVQNFLDYGAPVHPHDTVGWPTFKEWPGPTRLTEEGSYYTGIKRAWLAGLRLVVTDLVDNEALCTLMTMRRNPCNDMASVHIQSRDLFALQDYVDAQSGGPGKGWFRVVTNPFQARKVINQGKLAIVEGIEVSRIFGCGEQNHVSQCNQSDVDRGLAEVRRMGVSSFYPVHKFDNGFGGTKMDAGAVGAVVNGGNHLETGHFWDVRTCDGPAHDSQQLSPGEAGSSVPGLPANSVTGGSLTMLNGTPMDQLLPGGTVPVYPSGPHCNAQGLTDLGVYLINKMIDQHFLIEVDHMDVKTGNAALGIMKRRGYSGVVSPHSWSSPEQYPEIYRLGGFITPIAGSSPEAFVEAWRQDKQMRDPRFRFGFGYGSDMNGLADQSAPTAGHPISYPFRSYDGRVTFDRERWGQRVFDLNKDGLSNYGMYADWLEELRLLGGAPMMNDMMSGAESYLESWERAYGVPHRSCRAAGERLTSKGLGGGLRLGSGARTVLFSAGQPTARPSRAFRYCAAGGQDAVVFNSHQRAVLVASSATGARAGGVKKGGSARGLRGSTKQLARGLLVSKLGGFVYRVAGGRVRWVAAARSSETRSAAKLRSDLHAAGLK